jgi:GNAT superfamily N-acetyltransferase
MPIIVRPMQPRDEPRWRALWDAYNRFYDYQAPDDVTALTWQRILDAASHIYGIVAERDGQVVGIAHYILHENTWSRTPICCLEDLYVDLASRSTGVGRAIIDWLVAEMKGQRWSRLYWVTRETNYRARALYDTYGPHTGFVRYVIVNQAMGIR